MKTLVLILGIILIVSVTSSSYAEESKIPDWVKNIFVWYGQGQISEDDVLNALKFLIEKDILKIDLSSVYKTPENKTGEILSLPFTWRDDSGEFAFVGIIPMKENERPSYIEEGKKAWYLKFHYKSLLKEETFGCLWSSLEKVKIETDKGNIWKYNRYDSINYISFCPSQIDPLEEFDSDVNRFEINENETPKLVYFMRDGKEYIFNVKFVEP